MKFDKNTVIGFSLLAILLFGYMWNANRMYQSDMAKQQQEAQAKKAAEAKKYTHEDTLKQLAQQAIQDSITKANAAGTLTSAAFGTEATTVLENELVKVTLLNKGGRVKNVELKKYNSYNNKNVILGNASDKLGYEINTGKGTFVNTDNLFFTAGNISKNADGSQSVTYSLGDSSHNVLSHKFTLKPNNYMIDWDINITNANTTLKNNKIDFYWLANTTQHEKSSKYERTQMSNVCFYENNEFDYISAKTEHTFEKPTNWVSAVQQFFNTTVVCKNNFSNGKLLWTRETVDSSDKLGKVDVSMSISTNGGNVSVPMSLYYGPNDYDILKAQPAPEMARIINLGRDFYAFVRPINVYVIKPIFGLLSKTGFSYGIVILLLTVIIRLLTAPLMYGSYVSGAKMKILRPELEELKKKYANDQQGFAMAQMKFNKEAGVSMFGGCLPALLQIPIFFSLYSFFNTNIAVRGQEFLWSKDLSVYDSIASWSTSFLGVNHLSLFCLTAVLTSFLISVYNMSSTPTQDNPALKYMPYIFPFILFFVFNNLPSALTWYYTVSNTITLLLQIIIQKFVINHDKLVAQIEHSRKNPKTQSKSKWQERLEQMQEAQKKVQAMKEKNDANRKK